MDSICLLPRDSWVDQKIYTVLYRFKPDILTVTDQLVIDQGDFEEFLKDAPLYIHKKAERVKSQAKVYRITFFDDHEIEQDFHSHIYFSSDSEIQKIYKNTVFI